VRVDSIDEYRLASLDAVLTEGEGRTKAPAEIVPEWKDLQTQGRRPLMPKRDRPWENQDPDLSEVGVGRFLSGQSSSKISGRHKTPPSPENNDPIIAFVLAHWRFMSFCTIAEGHPDESLRAFPTKIWEVEEHVSTMNRPL